MITASSQAQIAKPRIKEQTEPTQVKQKDDERPASVNVWEADIWAKQKWVRAVDTYAAAW